MRHLPENDRVRSLEITKDMVERRDLSKCLMEKAG
jgi:ATP-dependent Clp protease ATP-binding subunit ClpX